jgi:hypothetical protein
VSSDLQLRQRKVMSTPEGAEHWALGAQVRSFVDSRERGHKNGRGPTGGEVLERCLSFLGYVTTRARKC